MLPYHLKMRIWGRAGGMLLTAVVAGIVCWGALDTVLPRPYTAAPAGPVLESVTPAQLTAMGLRLEATIQPRELPRWLSSLGVRPPTTIQLLPDAEAAVTRNSSDVRGFVEGVLTYATMTSRSVRVRGPAVNGRLVWALVGSRSAAGSGGSVLEVMWLVDAHSGRELVELPVPAPPPPAAASSPAGGGAGGP